MPHSKLLNVNMLLDTLRFVLACFIESFLEAYDLFQVVCFPHNNAKPHASSPYLGELNDQCLGEKTYYDSLNER